MNEPGDSSVEDILESIKKVIARDTRAAAVEQRRLRTGRAEAGESPAPVATPTASAPTASGSEDVLDLTEAEPYLDDSAAPQGEPEAALIAPESRAGVRESLAALAVVAEPPASPRLVRSGETSLEDLVRELLRPALAEWLDKNLPAMVEAMVAAEIARIVGKKS